ncbi:MAG: heparinase II/III family protein [Clostridia bacterium]|nr:heparinase II/III family protein [Clostridia bacterium]
MGKRLIAAVIAAAAALPSGAASAASGRSIIYENAFTALSDFRMEGGTEYASKGVRTGVYGRADTDYSYELKTEKLPPDAAAANRYDLSSRSAFGFDGDSFTYEFSIGADGDFNSVRMLTRTYFKNSAGATELVYFEPFELTNDGRILYNHGKSVSSIPFVKGRWYNAAITFYPKDCTYTLYFNGEKLIEKAWLFTGSKYCDSAEYDMSGFFWFQLQPSYNKSSASSVRSGSVMVDDTLSYYGEYYDDSDRTVEITAAAYEINDADGTISIEDGTPFDEVLSGITTNASEIKLFEDSSYAVKEGGAVSDGNILVLVSADKRAYKYYTVKSPETAYKFDSYARKCLEGKTALHTGSGYLYSGGEKRPCAVFPKTEEDEAYICPSDLESLLGSAVAEESGAYVIDGVTFYKDSYIYSDGASRARLRLPVKGGNALPLPLMSVCSALGIEVFTDFNGLYVIGDKNIGRADAGEINGYLFYSRPRAEHYKSLLKQNGGEHPRILLNRAGFEELKEKTASDIRLSQWHNNLIKRADNCINEPVAVYEKPDGLRLLDTCNAVESRVLVLSYAYRLTGDTKYAERGRREIEAACAFPDWNASNHFLDTGVMSFAFALYYDWCCDYLSEDMKDKIYAAVKKFALLEADKAYKMQEGCINPFFAATETNWNGVCNGSLACAALSFFERDEDFLSELLKNSIRCMEYAVYETGPDGAWHEGVGYWSYYLTYLTRFLASYKIAAGEPSELEGFSGMDKFGYFGDDFTGEQGINNFHDAKQDFYAPPALSYLADAYDNEDFKKIRLKFILEYGMTPQVEDMCFLTAGTEIYKGKRDVYCRGIEGITLRGNIGDNGPVFFSAHGGETEGAHYHYDAGAFVYDVLGERWAMDLGPEDYNASAEYGKTGMYRIRSEGHNTLTINPSENPGQLNSGFAPVTAFELAASGAYAAIDLTSMYSEAEKAERSFYLGDNRRSLTIHDELVLKEKSEVLWFMHTDAAVKDLGDGSFVLTKNGKSINVVCRTTCADAQIYATAAEPMETSPVAVQSDNTGISKLCINISGADRAEITVKLSPAGEGIDSIPDISSFKLPLKDESFTDLSSGGGLFGREAEDTSIFGENLFVPVDAELSSDKQSLRLSFYASFPESGGAVKIKGRTGGGASDRDLISFPEAGDSFRFMKNKWYKLDFFITAGGENTYSVYVDNKLTADKREMPVPDCISGIFAECAYIDDLYAEFNPEYVPSAVTLLSTVRQFNKYIAVGGGLLSYYDSPDDISASYLSKLGKKNIKNIQLKTEGFSDKYLVITTAQDEKLYMPVFGIGELLYRGRENEISLNAPSFVPVTVKYRLSADGDFEIFAKDGKEAVRLFTSEGFGYEAAHELAVTVYPGKSYCDVYIDGQLISGVGGSAITALGTAHGFLLSGNAQADEVICHTGGYFSDERFGEVFADEVSAGFTALSLKDSSCTALAAFYSGGRLTGLTSLDAELTSRENSYKITYDKKYDCDTIKIIILDSTQGLKPKTDVYITERK